MVSPLLSLITLAAFICYSHVASPTMMPNIVHDSYSLSSQARNTLGGIFDFKDARFVNLPKIQGPPELPRGQVIDVDHLPYNEFPDNEHLQNVAAEHGDWITSGKLPSGSALEEAVNQYKPLSQEDKVRLNNWIDEHVVKTDKDIGHARKLRESLNNPNLAHSHVNVHVGLEVERKSVPVTGGRTFQFTTQGNHKLMSQAQLKKIFEADKARMARMFQRPQPPVTPKDVTPFDDSLLQMPKTKPGKTSEDGADTGKGSKTATELAYRGRKLVPGSGN